MIKKIRRLRLGQECGQKWYYRRSWCRPLWRKLKITVFDKGHIDEVWSDHTGLHANGRITETHQELVGVVFGPIMLHWR